MKEKNIHAVALGKLGGKGAQKEYTEAQRQASINNGKKHVAKQGKSTIPKQYSGKVK